MTELEVRHCRALVAVHERGGITAAARALGVAQSTVSETLLSLERLFALPLTLRQAGREARLTAAGLELLPHARAMIDAADRALAWRERARTTLRLGAVESLTSFLLPEPLRDFRRAWPLIEVQVVAGVCAELRDRIGRGALDAALTVEFDAGDAAAETIGTARLVFVVAASHPLATARIDRRMLAAQRLIVTEAEGAFAHGVRAAIGADPAARIDSAGSIEGVRQAVRAGDAVGVMPRYAVARDIDDGVLAELRSEAALTAPIRLHLRPGGSDPALAGVVGLLRDRLSLPPFA